MDTSWEPLAIEEVAHRFAPFDVEWWIAGGHAIDCFLGWETRPHADLDIGVFRSDRQMLFDIFDGWELFGVSETGQAAWRTGSDIDPNVFAIWGRPSSDAPWAVEVMLADGDSTHWRYRRDPEIMLSKELFINWTSSGIPYSAPEAQLLFKSRLARQKDDVDLTRVLHRMSPNQRRWLAVAITRSDITHPWVKLLEMANDAHHE